MGRRLPWARQAQAVGDTILRGLGLPPGSADPSPGLIADEDMGGSARTYSAFAHGEMHQSDRRRLSAGLRYWVEDKSGRFGYLFYRSAANNPFVCSACSRDRIMMIGTMTKP